MTYKRVIVFGVSLLFLMSASITSFGEQINSFEESDSSVLLLCRVGSSASQDDVSNSFASSSEVSVFKYCFDTCIDWVSVSGSEFANCFESCL
jgi:hypothetical protein